MKAKFVLKRKEKRKVNKVVIDKTNSLDLYNNQCLLDPDPRKYADPRIQIKGAKYQPKTATTKKCYSQTQV